MYGRAEIDEKEEEMRKLLEDWKKQEARRKTELEDQRKKEQEREKKELEDRRKEEQERLKQEEERRKRWSPSRRVRVTIERNVCITVWRAGGTTSLAISLLPTVKKTYMCA